MRTWSRPSARARQAEPALGDEVALDLAGTAVDGRDRREAVAVLVERAEVGDVVRLHQARRTVGVEQAVGRARSSASVANSFVAAPSTPGSAPVAATQTARDARRSATSQSIASRARSRRRSGSASGDEPSSRVAVRACSSATREEPLRVAHPADDATLERERDQHHLPAAVHLADAPLVVDVHAVVERGVRALARRACGSAAARSRAPTWARGRTSVPGAWRPRGRCG